MQIRRRKQYAIVTSLTLKSNLHYAHWNTLKRKRDGGPTSATLRLGVEQDSKIIYDQQVCDVAKYQSINQVSGPASPWGGCGGSSSSWIPQASRNSATKYRCSAGMPTRDQLRSI